MIEIICFENVKKYSNSSEFTEYSFYAMNVIVNDEYMFYVQMNDIILISNSIDFTNDVFVNEEDINSYIDFINSRKNILKINNKIVEEPFKLIKK